MYVLFDNLTFCELLGLVDNDGYECPIQCPMNCGQDEMSCPGGDANGCMIPDFCMPLKGGEYQVDNYDI